MAIRLFFFILFSTVAIAETEQLGVVEVNGNKEEKTFSESQESISVIKERELNRGDQENSIQALNSFANVQVNRSDNSFSIRGINSTGVTGFQKDNLASIMVDDIFQTNLSLSAGSFELWDLEGVEIYRGAQSTTQGVNSLAGSILLNHRKASQEKETQAKLGLGNYGRKEVGGVINRAVGEKSSVRLSFNKDMTDGFIRNGETGNDRWGQKNKDHAVLDYVYQLDSTSSLRLNLKALRFSTGGNYVQGDYKDDKVTEDQDYKRLTQNQQLGIYYDKKFSEHWSNRLILAGTRAEEDRKADADGTDANTAGTRKEDEHDNFHSLENILRYNKGSVKNAFGIHLHRYYLSSNYRFNLIFPIGGSTTLIDTFQGNEKYRTVYSLYDSLHLKLSEKHALNLGGRLEIVQNKFGANIQAKRTENLGAGTNAALDAQLAALSGPYDDTGMNKIFLPKVGYVYTTGAHALGAHYSQGYRTGGLSINRNRAEVKEYGPERTHNYELSWKHVKEKSYLTGNLFYTDWKDQQVEVNLTNSFYDTEIRNSSTSKLYGAEVESSTDLKNGDSVRINAGHVKTRFNSFKTSTRNYRGNEFPDAAQWTSQLSYWKRFNDSMTLILINRYVGDSYSNAENTRKSPEQFYLDSNLQWAKGIAVTEFYVRNIFNQRYRIYDGRPNSTTSPYQASYHRVNPPREFGVRTTFYW
ncbi:MAG: TonB-dependent receptor [Bdellovibrionota bacterium]